MDFESIIKRALEIRQKYSGLEKLKYGREWAKQEITQGFVGDVGDLVKLLMAKEGVREDEDVDNKLKHELSDCLWALIVLSDKYGIDLEESFLETMNELEKKLA